MKHCVTNLTYRIRPINLSHFLRESEDQIWALLLEDSLVLYCNMGLGKYHQLVFDVILSLEGSRSFVKESLEGITSKKILAKPKVVVLSYIK